MKSALIALAILSAPVSLTAAGCASIEQVAPKSVRAAYADAEVALVGALNVAVALHQSGVISRDEFIVIFAKLEEAAGVLNTAYAMIRVGETAAAGVSVEKVATVLSEIALALSVRAETTPPPPPRQPVPTQGRAVVI